MRKRQIHILYKISCAKDDNKGINIMFDGINADLHLAHNLNLMQVNALRPSYHQCQLRQLMVR